MDFIVDDELKTMVFALSPADAASG